MFMCYNSESRCYFHCVFLLRRALIVAVAVLLPGEWAPSAASADSVVEGEWAPSVASADNVLDPYIA
jgi:hypothetical protein